MKLVLYWRFGCFFYLLVTTLLYLHRPGLEGGRRRYTESNVHEQSRQTMQHPASRRAL